MKPEPVTLRKQSTFFCFIAEKEVKAEPAVVTPTKRPSQGSESSFGNASVVDPVVVSFEEGMRLY